MRSTVFAAGSALLLVAGLVTIGTTAAHANPPAGQVCSPLDSGKTDVSGHHDTVTVTAPDGLLISGYCVKAGSAQNGDGSEYVTVSPPQKTVTFGHFSGKDVSHWSASYATIPAHAAASVSTTPATCTTGQALVLGTATHATWGTPTRTSGPGHYEVTATATAGHVFSDAKPSITFSGALSGPLTGPKCDRVVPSIPSIDPETPRVTGELCFLGDFIAGSINVELSDRLTYRITGNGVDLVATQAITNVAPGTYTVRAMAKAGYVLEDKSAWQVTVAAAQACGELETHPLVTPLASMTNLGCDTNGSYTLNAIDGVLWFVDGEPAAAGTSPVAAPGTVHVTAQADGPEYGLEFDTQTEWTFTFAAAEACGDLETLALTGAQYRNVVLLSAGLLLLFGGAALALSRIRRLRVE